MHKGVHKTNWSLLFIGVALFAFAFAFHFTHAQNYGTTCATAVDLTSTLGIGAGFYGLIESPYSKSWFISQITGSSTCANTATSLTASQQWVWYSLNAGTTSNYFSLSTDPAFGGSLLVDSGSVGSIIWTTNDCSSKTQCGDSPGANVKAKILPFTTTGTFKIAIGQYATSQNSAVDYSLGKTGLAQYCVSSCSVCSTIPAKLFTPNSPAPYNAVTSGATLSTICGDIYKPNYYTFTPHSAGSVLVSTCTSDAAIKTHTLTTKITVFSGSGCSSAIACVTGDSSCSNSAKVTFNVNQGITYTVVIGTTTADPYDGSGNSFPVFTFTCGITTFDHDNNQNTPCIPCNPVPNCNSALTCPNSLSICTSCDSGYYVDSGACIPCTPVPNCNSALTCSTSFNSVCTSCASGSYFNSGSCPACTPKSNCISLTCTNSASSICTACASGSYLDGESCSLCPTKPNCNTVTCSDGASSTCTNCNSGFYLSSGSCVACTPVANCTSALTCSNSSNSVCTSCSSGSYLHSGSCSVCPAKPNCAAVNCTNGASSTCISCNNNYYFSSSSCNACTQPSNCTTATPCTTTSNYVCTACDSGFYVSNGACAACTPVPNCNSNLTCSTSSNSVCTSCVSGHYLNGSSCSVCVPIPNCSSALTCSTSADSVCHSCAGGYFINNNSCNACTPLASCSTVTCSNSTDSICASCSSSHYLDHGSCSTCSSKPNCTSVTCSNSSNSICTVCASGSYLSSEACVPCTPVANCTSALTCSTSSNSVCTSCSNGSYLDSGSCTPCTSILGCNSALFCSSPSNSVCNSCVDGFYLTSGSCVACTSIANCNSTITCTNPTNSICTSCHSGYYLNGNTCAACGTRANCANVTCINGVTPSTCIICSSGYYLSNGACPSCSKPSGCATVTCHNGVSSNCTSCTAGYVLNSGSCLLPPMGSSASPTSSPTSTGIPNGNSNTESASSSPIAAIAGAAGGAGFLLLLILLVLLTRKRRNKRSKKNQDPVDTNMIPMQESNYGGNSSAQLLGVTSTPQLDRSMKPKLMISQQNQQYVVEESKRIPSVYTYEGVTFHSPVFSKPPAVIRQNKPILVNFIYESNVVLTSTVYPSNVRRDELYFMREIGNGEFASVHSGKMPEHWKRSNDSTKPPALPPKPGAAAKKATLNLVPCAIKCLKENSDKKTETDFIEEGKLMLEMDHPNIVKAFAIFMDAQPYLTVLEMVEYGDLLNVLHTCQERNLLILPHEFLHIISQIASGMEHLSEKPIIHRDLAARNVLLGSNLLVKISDFGLSRHMLEDRDYYKMNSDGKLPTRWMAPESLNMRKFSTASDVWSYGVTCWEIYTYGGFPYSTVLNKEIPAYLESNERLPCPPDCPIHLYELLLQCWNWDEYDRPTFAAISSYLTAQKAPTNAPYRDIGMLVRST